jgi:hypothetical protein
MAADQGDQTGGIEPGLYEVLYRQLTFRECWSLGGGFPLGLLPLIAKVWGWRDLVWLPPRERPCAASELSGRCRERLAPRVAMLKDLGFQRGTYIQSEDGLIEGGAYLALHNDGYRTMWLAWASTNETAKVATAGAFMFKDGASFSICTFPRQPSGEKHPTVVLPLAGLPTIAARLERELMGHRGALRSFADPTECEAANRERDRQIFGERIRRGLCRRFHTRMEAIPHPGEPIASDDAFVLRPDNKSFLDGSESLPLGLVKTVKRRQMEANAFPFATLGLVLKFSLFAALISMPMASDDLRFLIGPKATVVGTVLEASSKPCGGESEPECIVRAAYSTAAPAEGQGRGEPSLTKDHLATVQVRESELDRYEKGGPITLQILSAEPTLAQLPDRHIMILSILWSFCALLFFISLFRGLLDPDGILGYRRSRYLLQSGRPLPGWVIHSTSDTTDEGAYQVKIRYGFRSPAGRTIRGRDMETRPDLRWQPLPAPGTPVTVLVAHATNHQLL